MVGRADTRGYLFTGGKSDRLFSDFQPDSRARETRSARNFSPRDAGPMRGDSAAPCLKYGWRGAITRAGVRRRPDGPAGADDFGLRCKCSQPPAPLARTSMAGPAAIPEPQETAEKHST
jgi:hypothetical protein